MRCASIAGSLRSKRAERNWLIRFCSSLFFSAAEQLMVRCGLKPDVLDGKLKSLAPQIRGKPRTPRLAISPAVWPGVAAGVDLSQGY